MTAGLGSKYRYFGKLVLVPFRYFSIDIYRNIDIFDNTTSYIHSYIHFYFSLILDVDSSSLTDILYLCYVVDVLFISEPLNRLQGNLPQSLFLQNFLHI